MTLLHSSEAHRW